MSLYSICTVLVPVDTTVYLGNIHESTQVHVELPYIAMSHDSYVPFTEPQLSICMEMCITVEMHICQCIDVSICVHLYFAISWIWLMKAVHGKVNHVITLKPDVITHFFMYEVWYCYLIKTWPLICALKNRFYLLEYSTEGSTGWIFVNVHFLK